MLLKALIKALIQGSINTTKADKEALLDFFRNPDNFADKDIETITQTIGRWDCYDDWDRGRVPYEWRRKDLRLVVMTHSGRVNSVYLLNPNDLSRFDSALVETLWERPSDDSEK